MPVTGLKTCQPREPLADWVAGHLPRAGNDKLHCRLRLIFSLVFCISFLPAFALRPALLSGCPAVLLSGAVRIVPNYSGCFCLPLPY